MSSRGVAYQRLQHHPSSEGHPFATHKSHFPAVDELSRPLHLSALLTTRSAQHVKEHVVHSIWCLIHHPVTGIIERPEIHIGLIGAQDCLTRRNIAK